MITIPPSELNNAAAWRKIDYRPAIAEIHPNRLLPLLEPGSRILDVGCNTGATTRILSLHDHQCVGVDINPKACEDARGKNTSENSTYVLGDFLHTNFDEQFDAVIMIRYLTCVPDISEWHQTLDKAFTLIKVGGLFYVNDFLRDQTSSIYASRYDEGLRAGLREGNFTAPGSGGIVKFVAHHHTEADLASLRSRYDTLSFEESQSLSMNGNPCSMFEFIGRKPSS